MVLEGFTGGYGGFVVVLWGVVVVKQKSRNQGF